MIETIIYSGKKPNSAKLSNMEKDSDAIRYSKSSDTCSKYCYSENEVSGASNIPNAEHHQQNLHPASSNSANNESHPNDQDVPANTENNGNRGEDGDGKRSNDDKAESMLACNICFEVASAPVITLCGHMYCWECIIQWISVRSQEKCPVCRTAVTREKLIPFYGRGISSSAGPDPRRSNSSRTSRPYRMSFSPPFENSQHRDNPSNDMHFSFYGNLFGQEIAFGEGNMQPQHFLNLVFFGIAVFVMLLMTSPFPYYYYY